jgi:16S rRNA (guanine966-N2)-methyltransferase
MRISGGGARGIPLAVPKGELVRPATDGLRQAVFSSLGARVAGARFLDLFAGSGAYGLEAFSRGAAGGTFVERNPKAVACLRRNLTGVCRSLGRPESDLAVIEADVVATVARLAGQPDLIFADPPYELIDEVAPSIFARLAEHLDPAADALIVFELPGEKELLGAGWNCLKRIGRGSRQPTAAFYRRI